MKLRINLIFFILIFLIILVAIIAVGLVVGIFLIIPLIILSIIIRIFSKRKPNFRNKKEKIKEISNKKTVNAEFEDMKK